MGLDEMETWEDLVEVFPFAEIVNWISLGNYISDNAIRWLIVGILALIPTLAWAYNVRPRPEHRDDRQAKRAGLAFGVGWLYSFIIGNMIYKLIISGFIIPFLGLFAYLIVAIYLGRKRDSTLWAHLGINAAVTFFVVVYLWFRPGDFAWLAVAWPSWLVFPPL